MMAAIEIDQRLRDHPYTTYGKTQQISRPSLPKDTFRSMPFLPPCTYFPLPIRYRTRCHRCPSPSQNIKMISTLC